LEKFVMKKTLVALAALAATGAFAQSTVTLSGVLDVGLTYNSAVADGAATLGTGLGNNNRVIFSGVEDLGGGMAATFAAQMRFNPSTGGTEGGALYPTTVSGARPLFQGESRVGLRGGFGWIRLGRGLTALQQPNGGMIDPWGVSTVAGMVYAPGYATDYVAGGEGRTDGIFYDTPNMGGFAASLTYSPRTVGTRAGSFSKTFYSLAGTYVNGPIQALVGVEQNRYGDTLTNLGGNYDMGVAKIFLGFGSVKGGDAADRANVPFLATASSIPSCGSTRSAALGGNRAAGFQAVATPALAAGLVAGGNAGTACAVGAGETITSWTIGAHIPLGAARIIVGYSNWGSDLATQERDTKLGLGVNYALSKRTSIYADVATQTRNNNTNAVGTSAANNKDNQNQMDIGIAHSF
jgi:predicted porin